MLPPFLGPLKEISLIAGAATGLATISNKTIDLVDNKDFLEEKCYEETK